MSVAGGTFDHICKQLEAELLQTTKGGGGGVSNSQIQSMRCILEEAAESVHAHEEATRSGGGDGGDGALSFDGAVEFLLAYAGCSSTSNNTDDGGINEEEEESELLFTLFTTSMTGSRRVRDHDRRLKTLLFCLNIPFEEIDVSDNKYLQKKLGDAIVECAQSYGSSSSRNGGGGSALLAASPRVYRYCHMALNDDDVGTASIAAQQPSSNDEEGEFPTLATMSAVLSSQHAVGSAVTSTAMRYGLPVVFVKRQDGRGTSSDGVQQSSPYGAYLGTYAELQMMVDEQDYTPGGEEEDEEDENNNSSRFYNTNPEIDLPTPNITTTTTPSISKPSLLAQVIQDYARNQK